MRTTIDRAGRVVIPKALRDLAGLGVGGPVEIEFVDGRISIAPPVAATGLGDAYGLAVLVCADAGPVTAEDVRRVQDSVRGR